VAVWLAAIALAVQLARRQAVRVDAVGIAEVREAVVAPLTAGKVKFVQPDLFERVRAGEMVGAMDEALLVAELDRVQKEIARLRALIPAETVRIRAAEATWHLDRQDETRRFAWNLEGAELDLLDRRVAQEVDLVEREQLTIELERFQQLLKKGAASQVDVAGARLRREVVARRITENEGVIRAAERRRDAARTRRDVLLEEAELPPGLETQLEPIRRAVAVQQARLAELALMKRALTLRAPIDGVVSRVLLRPGEAAMAGTPILAIADPRSSRVVAHIPEGSRRLDLLPGDPVELLRRTSPVQVHAAKVLRVGPSVEEIPIQQRRNPDVLEWGRPVLITAANLDLHPGETVDVKIPRPPSRP
jgi:multidrug resistance efflux pump